MKKILFPAVLCLLMYFLFWRTPEELLYKNALNLAHAGQYDQALQQFQSLLEKHPENKHYMFDYLQTLSWAERHDEVMRQAAKIDINEAPVYVLETIAKAAHSLGDYPKAESLYRLAMIKAPDRLIPKLGIGLLLLDQGQAKPAIDYLQNLSLSYPKDLDIKLALAAAFELDGQFQRDGELYREVLAIQPDRKEAMRGLIMAMASVGDTEKSLDMAKANRGLLTDEQWASVNWDHAAVLIRQGEQALDLNPRDYEDIDRGIIEIQSNIESVAKLKLKIPAVWLKRANSDLLVALRDRKRWKDAIERYQSIQQQGSPLLVYGRMAAADAYLNNRQPEQARDLYLALSKEAPDDFNVIAALVHAYFETGQTQQMEQALQQLSSLVQKHPDRKRYQFDYLQILSWLDRNKEVIDQAANIEIEKAPVYVLEAVAKAARNLGDYQKAETLYRLATAKAPDRLAPRLGLALLQLDQHRAKLAIEQLGNLCKEYPEDSDIKLALAYAYELDGQIQTAGEFYRKILASQPDRKEARRGLIKSLAASGNLPQALAMAKANRQVLTGEQWVNLNWDYAALLIRQGDQALAKNPDDYAITDHAIAVINVNINLLKKLKLKDSPVWLAKAQSDLLVALRDRKRTAEVIAGYEQLQKQGLTLPIYGRMAAADAYMNNDQPEKSRDIYLAALEESPDDFDIHLALVHAYLETGQKPQMEQALQQLQLFVDSHPEKKHYLYDYLQALSWAERNDELMRQATKVDLDEAPVYVLEAIAKAARSLGDYQRAETLYRLATAKAPVRLVPKLGRGLLLLDQGQTKPAIDYLQNLSGDYPKDIDIKLALAAAHEMDGQFQQACGLYREVLAIRPDRKEAMLSLIMALAASGSMEESLEMAKANRDLLTDEQWASVSWDHAAWLIRQGEQALDLNPRDYRFIDSGITEIQNNLDSILQLKLNKPDVWLKRANADLLVALRDRKRMADAISRFQQMQKQGLALPAYGRVAVADAYLNNRRPEQARDLYLAVIKDEPDYYNAKASLVYAYLEAEQMGKALALAEQLAREQPAKIESKQTDGSIKTIDNQRKIAAELLAAVIHAYTDDLESAQARLEQLHKQFPDNTDIAGKLAEIYYFRGWPRKARQLLDNARLQAPEHFGLKLSQAKLSEELREYPEEESATRQLVDGYPEDSGTQKQMRVWEKYNAAEFKLFASGGISSNTANGPNPFTGSNNINIDGYLYSSPIDYNYRLFTHEGWKTGLFKEGRGFLTHYGSGIEYSKGNLLASVEVYYDSFRFDAVGANLALDYQLNDRWQLFTRLNDRDDTISLRALNSGVTANSAKLGATYRVNESRQFTVAGGYLKFSDDNNRYLLDSTYFERWYSGPLYKFSTYLNAGFSTNTSSNGPYFSPSKDAAVMLTLDNDLLTYRRYETAFHQRLALSAGNYWQENYGSNFISNLQYEHRWQLGNRFELTYGGARGYRYYDGSLTQSWQMYLTADIRF